ncbi:MAG TPA: cupin domain-containing protein [Thermoanaerobaculia bacterium]|nr:cupin domain-containing protein [Thermoanaerobaculia bacterium]
MNNGPRRVVLAAAGSLFASLALAVPIYAQDEAPVETPEVEPQRLLNAELSQFPGKQITVFIGEFQPGAETPLHRHPATEILFVLEGEGVMHIQGRDSRELKQGNVVLVEPDVGEDSFIHQAVNLSQTERMRTLVIVIHDEGMPPALPLNDH